MDSFLQALRNALPDLGPPVDSSGRILILDEKDPISFWNKFVWALENDQAIVLIDPAWPESWKQAYTKLAENSLSGESSRILIPTSGTTSKPKFCIHTLGTLASSAQAFAERFSETGIIHSVNVLPQHHVGGLMPVLRSARSGGMTAFASYTDKFDQLHIPFELRRAAISLVPTQLNRILQSGSQTNGLRQFGMILVGGAACTGHLLDQSRIAGLNLAPCYGSTETAAMVTVLDPPDFLAGNDSVGKPLPGMEVLIDQDNVILVHSNSVQTGYLPDPEKLQLTPFRTSDLGTIDEDGCLHIVGRADRIIITGGKKVIPEQVESAALKSGLVKDTWCHGTDDPDWGTRVELTVVFNTSDPHREPRLTAALKEHLPAYAIPKIIHQATSIPRNVLGKQIHDS